MKLSGPWGGRRPPATGKAFYIRELRGQLIMCKWPRKRGRPLHPTTLAQNEKFKQANWMAKYAPANVQMAMRNIVEGTNLLPRDLMVAAMFGRGFNWVMPTGRRRYPVTAYKDLSATLDFLGANVGNLLVRGPDGWVGFVPNAPGQVPVSGLIGEVPTWQTIGSQDGLWVQIEDFTLPATLGLDVAHVVNIAANAQEIEAILLSPSGGGSVRPELRVNGYTSTRYYYNLMLSTGSGSVTAGTANANSAFRFFSTGDTPLSNALNCQCNITRINSDRYFQIAGHGAAGNIRSTILAGYYNNTPSAALTSLQFSSDQGVGLKAGTRIIVRGIFP